MQVAGPERPALYFSIPCFRSATKDVSKDWGPASGSLPGPGNGVQTKSGRLLVAAHHSAYVHDFIVWSDDEGASWTPIKQTFPKMDEATMTQLTNGSVSGLFLLLTCSVAGSELRTTSFFDRLIPKPLGNGEHASRKCQDSRPRSRCLK